MVEGIHAATVVICTHNRIGLLLLALESIWRCNYAGKSKIEILVVANACTDNTVDAVAKWSAAQSEAGYSLRVIEEARPGKSYALNRAVAETNSPAIAFIDDDQTVHADWLTALTSAIESQVGFDMFCGWLMPAWDGTEPAWVHENGTFRIPIRPFPEYDLGEHEFAVIRGQHKVPSGGNLVVRRHVFESVGLFSTDLGPRGHNLLGGEDSDFINRALNAGAKLLYVPSMRQFHATESARMSSLYMLRKSYLRSYSAFSAHHSKADSAQVSSLITQPAIHLLKACWASERNQRFYWLMRAAANLGELVAGVSLKLSR